eukprot:262727-Amphidinium_carterae.1
MVTIGGLNTGSNTRGLWACGYKMITYIAMTKEVLRALLQWRLCAREAQCRRHLDSAAGGVNT